MRQCGSCTLCCRLVPQKALEKEAGQRCHHQRHTGCAIYARRPLDCRLWSCEWLLERPGTEQLSRPDRSHLVIDQMPDFITVVTEEGERANFPVMQVWCDPRHRDAHRDPAFRAYVNQRGAEDGMLALVRFGSTEGLVLVPPSMSGAGWIERSNGLASREHTAEERAAVLGNDLLAKAMR